VLAPLLRVRDRLRPATGPEDEHEPAVQKLLNSLARKGFVCADVGANEGVMTELLARRVGKSGRVVAFEPHPDNAAVIRRRLEQRGLGRRVTVREEAVSDGSASTVSLYPGRHAWHTEWNIRGHDIDGRATEAVLEIPAVALDAVFPPGSRLDLVKIDVEGAEGLVLAGMRRLLAEARPALVVEFHDADAWASRAILLDAGYRLYDTSGTPVADDADRVYHCLALPAGTPPPGD